MSRIRVRVRTASVDDLDELVTLAEGARDLGLVGRGRRAARSWPDGFRARCTRLLADPAHRVVVAVDEADAVVGAAVFADTAGSLLDPPSVYVSHLLVAPEHRRRGAGRALVAAAACYAEELGVDSVVVGVAPTTRDANRFFARLGFAPLVIRRIAPVAALRRTLASADPTGDPLPGRSGGPGRSALARALPRSTRARLRRTG